MAPGSNEVPRLGGEWCDVLRFAQSKRRSKATAVEYRAWMMMIHSVVCSQHCEKAS